MIVLRLGSVSCTVLPGSGGAIGSLELDGRAILRPTPSPGQGPGVLDTACFPLVPFANRIGEGRFAFGDETIALPPDPVALPHALHGFGWRNAWIVERRDASAVRLRYAHAPDAWPWRFEATQDIVLREGGCAITLAVTNLESRPMPCGLGLHPYFVRDATSAIVTAADTMLATGPNDLPAGLAEFVAGRRRIGDLEPFDNLLIDDSGAIAVETNGLRIDVRARTARGFHVYVPADGDSFCVEPVSQWPNSFQDAQYDELAPGQRRAFDMTIVARPLPPVHPL